MLLPDANYLKTVVSFWNYEYRCNQPLKQGKVSHVFLLWDSKRFFLISQLPLEIHPGPVISTTPKNCKGDCRWSCFLVGVIMQPLIQRIKERPTNKTRKLWFLNVLLKAEAAIFLNIKNSPLTNSLNLKPPSPPSLVFLCVQRPVGQVRKGKWTALYQNKVKALHAAIQLCFICLENVLCLTDNTFSIGGSEGTTYKGLNLSWFIGVRIGCTLLGLGPICCCNVHPKC